jgi:hypothetical protein
MRKLFLVTLLAPPRARFQDFKKMKMRGGWDDELSNFLSTLTLEALAPD